eukprot:TRINITY_DN10245_c0_g1_i1.p1 TRINITY_DN10245_c0_g1~~TRINITY_DN10245_c0_g1_i1.p1  ORF type:complete len:1085 (-),score=233.26 TRINITY_DN10245_c0_g1_i1:17-3238(-)
MSMDFINLLNEMRSESNTKRAQAESFFFRSLRENPSQVILNFIEATSCTDEGVRCFIAITLRKILKFEPSGSVQSKMSLFYRLDDQIQGQLLSFSLEWLQNEQSDAIRSMIADLICELGITIFSQGHRWTALIDWCLGSVSTTDPVYKKSFYRVSRELGAYFPNISDFSVKTILDMYISGLTFQDLDVQTESVIALSTIIQFLVEFQDQLTVLIDPMLQVLSNNISAGDQTLSENVLSIFVELAELNPGFFMPKLDVITNIMIDIASNEDFPDDINSMSCLFLVSLAESKPLLCKSNVSFVDSCIKVSLKMMIDIDEMEEDTWNNCEDEFEDTNFENGAHYLDRLAIALGGMMVPVIMPYLQELSASPDWRCRHALLRAFSVIAEGCADALFSGLSDIVGIITSLSRDQHPRVRLAAFYAIGQLSTDLGPQIQIFHHDTILPAIIQGLQDNYSKIRKHACAATLNFTEKFDRRLIEPYLQQLMGFIFPLLSEPGMVQEEAVACCSLIAWCSRDLFIPYYKDVVQTLIHIFHNCNQKTERSLMGYAVEAISTISIGVGEAVFINDAQSVLEMLKQSQEMITDPSDPIIPHFEQAWIKFATCLGPKFEPYLAYVLPGLFEKLDKESELIVAESAVELPGWEYYDTDIGRIGYNTQVVADKLQALTVISKFSINSEKAFYPYIQTTCNLVIPLLTNPNHDLRMQSYILLPTLLQSARFYVNEKEDKSEYNTLFNYIYPQLVKAATEEFDTEIMERAVDAVRYALLSAGKILNSEQLVEILNLIQTYISVLNEYTETLLESNLENDSDFSVNVKDELFEQCVVVVQITEMFDAVMKYHTEDFISIIQVSGFLDFIIQLLNNPISPANIIAGIGFIDDVINYGRESTRHLYNTFVPLILSFVDHEDHLVRQTAAYGLGCSAQRGGDALAPFLQNVIAKLMELIDKEGSLNKTNLQVTENAISAIGKVIKYQASALGQDKSLELFGIWIKWLPIQFDESEGIDSHEILGELLTENPSLIQTHLPELLLIISKITHTDLVNQNTQQILSNIVINLHQELGDNLVAGMPEINQARLQKIFQ